MNAWQLSDESLLDMNMQLLKLLFPRRPGEKPPIDPRASTPKKDDQPEKQP